MDNYQRLVKAKGQNFLIKMETSSNPEDYRKYEAIRNAIWEFPDDHFSGPRNMMCENYLEDGSAVFIGVFRQAEDGSFRFDGEHLVGFCYGFVGVRDKKAGFRSPENLWFYSQFAGVVKPFQRYGLSISMKEFQREIVLNLLGIKHMVCTYDPLTAVNAYRNVHHFRMHVIDYKVDVYGQCSGLLNREDIPSDRFFMDWDLAKEPARSNNTQVKSFKAAGTVIKYEREKVSGRNGEVELEVVRDFSLEPGQGPIRVPIPSDFYLMLQATNVPDERVKRIPFDWRLATRAVFQKLFSSGYKVVDFISQPESEDGNFYVLDRQG